MRNLILIVGALVLVAGSLVTAGVVALPQRTELMRIGDTSLGYTARKPPPRQVGYGLMALGGLGLVIGLLRRR
jgi:hypothetical protein